MGTHDNLLGPAFIKFVRCVGKAVVPPGVNGYPTAISGYGIQSMVWNADSELPNFAARITTPHGPVLIEVYPPDISTTGSIPMMVLAFHEFNDCCGDHLDYAAMIDRIHAFIMGAYAEFKPSEAA